MSKKFLSSAAFFIVALVFYAFSEFQAVHAPTVAPSPQPSVLGVESSPSGQLYKVTRVVDGDTIEVTKNNKDYKVRYVGVDTPETVDPRRGVGCFGHEASNKNKELVEGKEVILKKDVSETDKYGRLLRLVYLKLDSNSPEASSSSYLFVNDYLVREGYAKVLTVPPDVSYAKQFQEAQQEAESQQKGLWNPSTCNGITTPSKE